VAAHACEVRSRGFTQNLTVNGDEKGNSAAINVPSFPSDERGVGKKKRATVI
jgi:hypothetical protein